MSASAVEVRVGGQTYRVVASAAEEELHRLAETVDDRLRGLTRAGRPVGPQTILLAAIALAHDLEEEKRRRRELEERHRLALRGLLARIDAALDGTNSAAGNDENAANDGDEPDTLDVDEATFDSDEPPYVDA